MISFLVKFIEGYQALLSPDHSFWGKKRFPHGYCRFYPSCSEYAKQSLLEHGLLRGIFRASTRVLRCNPFSTGGYDPVTKQP